MCGGGVRCVGGDVSNGEFVTVGRRFGHANNIIVSMIRSRTGAADSSRGCTTNRVLVVRSTRLIQLVVEATVGGHFVFCCRQVGSRHLNLLAVYSYIVDSM